jgi:hypothetical protein
MQGSALMEATGGKRWHYTDEPVAKVGYFYDGLRAKGSLRIFGSLAVSQSFALRNGRFSNGRFSNGRFSNGRF